jgi:hypothetical protein
MSFIANDSYKSHQPPDLLRRSMAALRRGDPQERLQRRAPGLRQVRLQRGAEKDAGLVPGQLAPLQRQRCLADQPDPADAVQRAGSPDGTVERVLW